MMNAHFQTMARYDLWATRRLLSHISLMSEEEYRRDAGLYFGSVHGTLNHLLVTGPLLWFRRFAEGVSPTLRLDDEAEPDRARLAARLEEGTLAWGALIASWPASRFEGRLDYVSLKGTAMSLPFAATLAHVFNHGTHHRGQVSAALTTMGRTCPELDLLWMVQEEAGA